MTPDERLRVQQVVMDFLQQDAADNPTHLIDVLLSGDGWQLVHHVISSQEAFARRRADTLAYLLKALLAERLPPPQAQPQPFSPQPPIAPYQMPPAPGIPRGE